MPANDLWVTRFFAASLCGMGERNFDSVIRPRLPLTATQGTGRTLRFHAPEVVSALVSYRIEQAKPADGEGDPLLAGGDSPNLERYRGVKADLATLDLKEREKELIRGNVLNNAIRVALAALRGTGDRLTRQFGNEAGDIYNEGVNEFENTAIAAIQKFDASDSNTDDRRDTVDTTVGGGDEDAATPDDQ